MGNCTSHQANGVSNSDSNQQQGNRVPQNSNYARYPPTSQSAHPPPSTSYMGGTSQQRPPQNAQIPPWQQQRERQQQQQQQSCPQSLTQTATIRNAVNLQKSTLKIVPSQIDPNILTIEFHFDASEPCCVMTFSGVQEHGSKGGALVPAPGMFKDGESHRSFAPLVEYSAGMGQRFPKNDMSLVSATSHSIDLNTMNEDRFLDIGRSGKEDRGVYSLVIRLATISEQGRKEGYTLNDIIPDSPLSPWIQSQTTYASIAKEGDVWRVQVLKQKLWVDGVSYMLQEIYGLENVATGTPNGVDTNEDHLCVICLSNRKDTTALPCRHMCMCHECADALRKQSSICPICRNKVESLLRIKLNGRQEST